jgi:hypothetical protein
VATDLLARWWSEPFWVRRLTGNSPNTGESYGPRTQMLGRVRNQTKVIRDTEGNEVVSASSISMSVDTAAIPVDSLVDFGDEDSPRRVIAEAPHRAVGTPNFYSIDLD